MQVPPVFVEYRYLIYNYKFGLCMFLKLNLPRSKYMQMRGINDSKLPIDVSETESVITLC